MASVAQVALVALSALGIAATGACKSKEVAKQGADDAAPGPKEVEGPFANAVQVSERGWMITDDRPPPLPDEDRGGGAERKRFGRSPLYVDGKGVAVVTYGELPPWLPTRPIELNDGRKVNRFLLAEYFEAIDIPLAKIKEVHFYGGRGRVAVMPGKEIRRGKDLLRFSFTQGDGGKMRMHWDGELEVSDTIDKIRAVAVYIDKKPPKWDRAKWGLVDDAGNKYEGVPYVEVPLKGGLRIYKDGRIAHVLKRNRAFNRGVKPHRMVDGVPYFRLFDYLDELEVDVSDAAVLELLHQNDVARRLTGAELAAEKDRIEISAPPKSGGQVLVHLGPPEKRISVEVTAIALMSPKRSRPTHRR